MTRALEILAAEDKDMFYVPNQYNGWWCNISNYATELYLPGYPGPSAREINSGERDKERSRIHEFIGLCS